MPARNTELLIQHKKVGSQHDEPIIQSFETPGQGGGNSGDIAGCNLKSDESRQCCICAGVLIFCKNSQTFSPDLLGYSTVYLNLNNCVRSHLNKEYPQHCIFEKDHHRQTSLNFHKNQRPIGLKNNQTLPEKRHKYRCAFPTKPPYIFI